MDHSRFDWWPYEWTLKCVKIRVLREIIILLLLLYVYNIIMHAFILHRTDPPRSLRLSQWDACVCIHIYTYLMPTTSTCQKKMNREHVCMYNIILYCHKRRGVAMRRPRRVFSRFYNMLYISIIYKTNSTGTRENVPWMICIPCKRYTCYMSDTSSQESPLSYLVTMSTVCTVGGGVMLHRAVRYTCNIF